MLAQIERWVQNGAERSFASNYFFFFKFCFSLRTSFKELIWCAKDSNVHIHTFRKRWSLVWGCFSPASILKIETTGKEICVFHMAYDKLYFPASPLREMCANTEYFLVRIFLHYSKYSKIWTRKKLRIWTLFMQFTPREKEN